MSRIIQHITDPVWSGMYMIADGHGCAKDLPIGIGEESAIVNISHVRDINIGMDDLTDKNTRILMRDPRMDDPYDAYNPVSIDDLTQCQYYDVLTYVKESLDELRRP
jgi:hypothetical protein